MTTNEIKKANYKQAPTAMFQKIRVGVAYYSAVLNDGFVVEFQVPVADMGDADYLPEMPGKLLNRYIANGTD